jgi:hypothetical protein
VQLLAEMEVRGHRVLEEVDAEIADQHEQEGVGHLGALRQHPHEGGRQHEAGAQGHAEAERRAPPTMRARHDGGAGDVGGRGHGHQDPLCYHDAGA